MANLTEDSAKWVIRWRENKIERKITLGKVSFSKQTAAALADAVTALIYVQRNPDNPPSQRIMGWLESCDAVIKDKLTAAELIETVAPRTARELFDDNRKNGCFEVLF